MTRTYLRFLSGAAVVAAGLAIGAFGASPLSAQAQAPGLAPQPLPRFEVAALKPSTNPTRAQTGRGGAFLATQPLKLFIADAYLGAQPLAMSRVLGGPEWIETARYEINARGGAEWLSSPDGPDRNLLLMVRSLLEERFTLKAHIETREMPVYELVIARADGTVGPALRRSTVDCDAIIAAVRAGGPRPQVGPGDPPPCGAMRGPARILAGGVQMEQFASMLTNILIDVAGPTGSVDARRVIDKTGLTGRFAFTMAWTPEKMPTEAPPPGIPPVDPNGPSFFTALQEQLGLKIQAARVPQDVVVVDSIERPTTD